MQYERDIDIMTGSSDSIGIDNIQGDVSAGKVEGIGNITGKEVHVTIQGDVFNLGNELKGNIKELLSSSNIVPKSNNDNRREISNKIKDAKTAENTIEEIMKLLKVAEKETDTKLENIKVGDYKISTSYLQAKKLVLDGNKSFFKKEYEKAIDYEPYSADVWYNKGSALEELGKYDAANKCYDNAIDIEPDHASAWYAKGNLI